MIDVENTTIGNNNMPKNITLLKRTVSLDERSIEILHKYGITMGTNSLSAAIRMIAHNVAFEEMKNNIKKKGI
jgi:hypothetical protein